MAGNPNLLEVKLQKGIKPPRPLHQATMNNPSHIAENRHGAMQIKSIIHGNQKINAKIPYTGLSGYNPSFTQYGTQPASYFRRPRLSTYKSTSVTMHTEYDVLVCNIEDGPKLFSVQLLPSLDCLKKMMLDLETIHLVPVDNIDIGTACLARYSYDSCIYRAVVTAIRSNECSVAYIDYGHSETVSFQNLFTIPENFLEHNTFSIKFSLTGCKSLELTPQVKTKFRDLVLLQEVKLKVTPLDGPPLYQYCELYVKGQNVLEILQNSFGTQQRYNEPPPLVNNEKIIVRLINSPRDFYVQKLNTLKNFHKMMDSLNLYCKQNHTQLQFFKKGMPCALFYENHYYRGEIVADFSHGEVAQVLHVDFGYTHMMEKKNIVGVPVEFTIMPKLAIHCCLKGFEDEESIIRDSVVTQFEMLSENNNGERSEFFITVFKEFQCGTYLVNLKNVEGLDLMKKLYKLSQPFNKYIDLEKKEQQLQMNSTSTSNDINETLESNGHRNPNGTNRIVREPINANARVAFESRNSSAVSDDKAAEIRERQQTPFINDNFNISNNNNNHNNSVLEARKLTSVQERLNVSRDANFNHQNSQNGHQSYNQNRSLMAEEIPTITIEDSIVEEYVSFDTPFPVQPVPSNSKQTVSICWWYSPFQFYTFDKNTNQLLATLTKQLKEFYSQKKPIAKFLKVGSFVIATDSKRQFYRAKIIATNPMMKKYKVYLVDHGINLTITDQDVFEVEKRFTMLPKMVNLCSLQGIISNIDHDKAVKDLTPLLNHERNIVCEFLSFDDQRELHFVNLLTEGKHVIDEMCRIKSWSRIGSNIDFNFLSLQQIRGTIVSVSDMLHFKIKIEGFDFPLMCSYDDIKFVKANPDKAEHFKEYYENKSFVLNVATVTSDKVFLLRPLSALFHEDDPTYICRYPLISNEINVRVIHVEDYNTVFVHLIENENKINKLNDDMFEYYETNGTVIAAIKEQQICAAKSSDGNWYRAKVTKINPTTDKVQVSYFDYGIFEDVEKSKIKHIENEFCLFSSALAIELLLPIGDKQETEKTVILNEIKSLTDEFVLKARILDCYYNVFIADLYTDNFSVLDVLKGKGLMKEPEMQQTYNQINSKPVLFYEFIETVDLTKDEDDIVADLIPNNPPATVEEPTLSVLDVQVLNSRVVDVVPEPKAAPPEVVVNVHADKTAALLSHCDNPGKFFLQLATDMNELDQLQENLQIVAASLPPLMRVVKGASCICNYSVDQQWYRAKIIDSELLIVQFMDFGNTDALTEHDVKDIKEPVNTEREPFCLEYSLPIIPKGSIDWCDEANKIFNDSFDKTCYFEIIAKGEKKTFVNLFIENLNISEYLISNGYGQPMEMIASGVVCFVSHINNLSDFYVQLESDSKGMGLMETFLAGYEKLQKISENDCIDGKICAAFYSDDGNWYRAKILNKVSDQSFNVLYIDYGNTGVTNQIRELPKNIAELPFLAKKCSLRLPCDLKSWSEEAEAKFSQIAAAGETVFVVELKEPGEHVTVDLFVDSKNILEELETLCEKKPPGTEDLNLSVCTSIHLSINEPDLSQPIEAIISHVNAPYDFFIQLSSSLPKIEYINNVIAELPIQKIEIPVLGIVCGVYFPEYETYYRGLLNRCTDDGKYSILFIDFGNEIIAPRDHLIVLPADIKDIEPLAIRCSLENNKGFRENKESIAKFKEIEKNYDRVVIKIVDKDQNPWIIKLFGNEENLCEKLNNALGTKVSETTQDKLFITTHYESSKAVFIQNEEQNKVSDFIIAQLNDNADALENLSDPKIGDICVAFFNEDETFYRAKITEILENGKYNVHFIDFGNNAISDKIKIIPNNVAQKPLCCQKCWIEDIKDETQFSNTMEKYFGQKFNINILESSSNNWKIDILVDGVNITEELRNSKPNVTVEADNNLIYSFKKCRVIFTLSPNDFYVTFNEDLTAHDNIKEMLLVSESFDKLESPKVGDFCIAKFKQDGAYYRAEVIAVNENGIEVLFVDFGNTAFTDDLRVIPQNDVLKNINTRAKHCALENLSDVDFWTEEACNIFNELINRTSFNETFQVEILQTNTDPWIVRLFFDERDVARMMISKMQPNNADCELNTAEVIVDDLVRELTELNTENSLILNSKDIVMDIIDNIHCSSGHGSMDLSS
ncbi:TDRD6 family protein [Megaselia abdita]